MVTDLICHICSRHIKFCFHRRAWKQCHCKYGCQTLVFNAPVLYVFCMYYVLIVPKEIHTVLLTMIFRHLIKDQFSLITGELMEVT